MRLIRARSRHGLTAAQIDEIQDFARSASNNLAPFLLFVALADAAPAALRPRRSTFELVAQAAPPIRSRWNGSIDWAHLAKIDAEFLGLVRGRSGLEGPPED
jgi:hypothetical protein